MSNKDRVEKAAQLEKAQSDVERAVNLYKNILPEASLALGRFIDNNRFGQKLYFDNINQILNST